MTDFRQMHSLHAYSGGTVRDSHPVLYSPVGLLPRPQALKRNIYLPEYDTRLYCKSQSERTNTTTFLDKQPIKKYIGLEVVL